MRRFVLSLVAFLLLLAAGSAAPMARWPVLAVAAPFAAAAIWRATRAAWRHGGDLARVWRPGAWIAGRRVAVAGRLVGAGERLETPFRHRSALLYVAEVERRAAPWRRLVTHGSLAMAPTRVRTADSEIQLLSFPRLSGLPRQRLAGSPANQAADTFLASSPFPAIGGVGDVDDAIASFTDTFADASGRVERRWRFVESPPAWPVQVATERSLAEGEEVVVLGCYAAEHAGLRPRIGDARGATELLAGDRLAVALRLLSRLLARCAETAALVLLLLRAILP